MAPQNTSRVIIFFFRLSEVDHFQQVLSHPAFKANPLDTITQHIKNATALKKI